MALSRAIPPPCVRPGLAPTRGLQVDIVSPALVSRAKPEDTAQWRAIQAAAVAGVSAAVLSRRRPRIWQLSGRSFALRALPKPTFSDSFDIDEDDTGLKGFKGLPDDEMQSSDKASPVADRKIPEPLLKRQKKETIRLKKSNKRELPKGKVVNHRAFPLWPGIQDEMVSFGNISIPVNLSRALRKRGITEPTDIQSKAFDTISEGHGTILHAPTGSGKTLAYLLPLVARLQPTLHVGLQAIILVPTPELALQVCQEVTWLLDQICGEDQICWFNQQISSRLASTVVLSRRGLWDAMRQDSALMVTTPGIVFSEIKMLPNLGNRFIETFSYFMCSNLHAIVIDEVDKVFSKDYLFGKNPTQHIRSATPAQQVLEFFIDVIRFRYRNRPIQFTSASATSNFSRVQNMFSQLLVGKWPKRKDAHRRIQPTLISSSLRPDAELWVEMPETIVHCTSHYREKDTRFHTELMDHVVEVCKPLKGTVFIFLPVKVQMGPMIASLQDAGLSASKYRSAVGLSKEDITSEEIKIAQAAKKSGQGPDINAEEALRMQEETMKELRYGGFTHFFLAKADSIRGIDVPDINTVIICEPPVKPEDYLHLAGRTGRIGKRGQVVTLVNLRGRGVIPYLEMSLGFLFNDWDLKKGEPILKSLEKVKEVEKEEAPAVSQE